jgi:hypothetical protein
VPLSRNLGTLTSCNPLGLSRPVTGLIYLIFYPHYEQERYICFCSNCNQHAVGWLTGTDCISITRARNECLRSVCVFHIFAFALYIYIYIYIYIAQGPWVVQKSRVFHAHLYPFSIFVSFPHFSRILATMFTARRTLQQSELRHLCCVGRITIRRKYKRNLYPTRNY